MTCIKCGKENRTKETDGIDAKYCRFCNTPLIQPQNTINEDSIIGREDILKRLNGIIGIKINDKQREEEGYQSDMDNKLLLFIGEEGTGKSHVADWFQKSLEQKKLMIPGPKPISINEIQKQYADEFALSDYLYQNMNKTIIIDDIHLQLEYAAEIFRAITSTKLGIICICCGEKKPVEEFLDNNPDLKQKIYGEPFKFEPYSLDELNDILKLEIKQRGYELPDNIDAELKQLINECKANPETYQKNGWMIQRAVWPRINNAHSARTNKNGGLNKLLPEDIVVKKHNRTEEEIFAELNSLSGLEEVKTKIRDIWATVKTTMERRNLGLTAEMPDDHLVFRGGPGTGKTTVARLLGELFNSIGLTYKKEIVEVSRKDLCGQFVGQTAPLVKKVCEKAMGGILFIDEAYTLSNGDSYGQEAIDTLLKIMEDNRGKLIVIVAGYPEEMNKFLNSNPGLSSRFNEYNYVDFKDYEPDTLLEVYQNFASKENFVLTDAAQKKVSIVINKKYILKKKNFANAREMRNLWKATFKNFSSRSSNLPEEERTINVMKTIEAEDIPEVA